MAQNWEKILLKIFLKKLQFTYPYAFKEKHSALRREHPALQKMKFFYFSIFLGHFCPPESESGSTTLDKTIISSLFFTAKLST
jgi:hypothetical protein